jgi:hypothetical protein
MHLLAAERAYTRASTTARIAALNRGARGVRLAVAEIAAVVIGQVR